MILLIVIIFELISYLSDYLPMDLCFHLSLICMFLVSLNAFRLNHRLHSRVGRKCCISRAEAARHQYQPLLQLRREHRHRLRRPPQPRPRGQRGEPVRSSYISRPTTLERISTWHLSFITGRFFISKILTVYPTHNS